MSKEFDKTAFQKSQKKFLLACITIGVIGLISVICSFFVGGGFSFKTAEEEAEERYQAYLQYNEEQQSDDSNSEIDFGEDPKDYYGDYYYQNNFTLHKISIDQTGVTITSFDLFESSSTQFTSQYCSAEYSEVSFGRKSPALLLSSYSTYKTMWLTKDATGAYSLTDKESGAEYQKTPITVEELLNDPKDYYGTYYGTIDYTVLALTITTENISVTSKEPLANETTDTYQYAYIPAEYANLRYQKQQAAILVYTTKVQSPALILWVTINTDGTYSFETSQNITYTTQEITFSDLVNDPQNYYGTYRWNDANILTLNANGRAVFMLNGVETEYDFIYVDQAWLQAQNISYYPAIVLFEKGNNQMTLFKIDDNGNMVFGNQYTFQKQ